MTLPFLHVEQGKYTSSVYKGLTLSRKERHLSLFTPDGMECLGSAVYGGGMRTSRRWVNIYVDRFYNCDDPVTDIKRLFNQWEYPLEETTGLLTAVKLQHVSVAEVQGSDAAVFCCTTAGVSNSARAGSERTTFPASYTPGTINIMIAVDGRLDPSAMVGAIMTATEAKTAALSDLGVTDAENGLSATGTTTDSIMIGVSQSADYSVIHPYAGTATDLGSMIGRLVYTTVTESLQVAGIRR